MTQMTLSASYPIDDTTTDGTELALLLSDKQAADLTNHSGASQPSYIEAGGIWAKEVGSDFELYFYDGTQDHYLGFFDESTGLWTVKGSNITIASSAPSSPFTGEFWLDSDDNNLNVYDGAAWQTVVSADVAEPSADIDTQTGIGYSLVVGDNGKDFMLTHTSAKTVTIPASGSFPVGYQCALWNIGGSTVAVAIDASDTINGGAAGVGLSDVVAQYDPVVLMLRAANTWVCGGVK